MHRRLACLLKSYVEPHSTSSIVARVAKQPQIRVATVNFTSRNRLSHEAAYPRSLEVS